MLLFFCTAAQKAKRLLVFWPGATKTEGFVWQSGPVDPWHQFLCLHLPFVFVCTLIFTSSLIFTLLHKLFVHFFSHNLVFRQNAGFSFTTFEVSVNTEKFYFWFLVYSTVNYSTFREFTNKAWIGFWCKRFSIDGCSRHPNFLPESIRGSQYFFPKGNYLFVFQWIDNRHAPCVIKVEI